MTESCQATMSSNTKVAAKAVSLLSRGAAPDRSYARKGLLAKTGRANPLPGKEGQARSAGVVCSKTRSHLIDARVALLINRYCSSLNRPPQPSLCEVIPALLRRGMALTLLGTKDSQESVAPTVLILSSARKPRAFARGYDLPPLRGSSRMRFARYLRQDIYGY
jgi:hypothetical protein